MVTAARMASTSTRRFPSTWTSAMTGGVRGAGGRPRPGQAAGGQRGARRGGRALHGAAESSAKAARGSKSFVSSRPRAAPRRQAWSRRRGSVAASRSLWVTTTAVMPSRAFRSASRAWIPSAVRGVEVAGRLVGQQQPRAAGRGPGPGPPAAARRRRARRAGGPAGRPARPAPASPRPRAVGLGARQPPDQRRHHGVLQGGELREQVVALEDEADGLVAEGGQGLLARGEDVRGRRRGPGRRVGTSRVPSTWRKVLLPDAGRAGQRHQLARRRSRGETPRSTSRRFSPMR